MIQFYFLSILFNAASGYTLAMEDKDREGPAENGPCFFLNNETLRLILGILTLVSGLLKLLSSIQGDIPIIGDLLPAVLGLLTGFILVFDYYHTKTSIGSEKSELIERIIAKNKRWLGFAAIASAVLHFLFPTVLFL
ncbi:MAG: hypothetical protein LBP71_02900 [Spirochaetaceae bacterium]|jgi:uncharacterized membrane-anchored protein|nr:hypothetical protein [Spirochaetaceae bacterium]